MAGSVYFAESPVPLAKEQLIEKATQVNVLIKSKHTGSIVGMAQSKGSLHGEIKRNSFAFTYDSQAKIFSENNLQASYD